MKKFQERLLLSLFFYVFAFFLCSPCSLAAKQVEVDLKDSGKTICLDIGDKLLVALPGNATTGFTWTLVSPSVPSLKFLKKRYKSHGHPPLVGAPGTFFFKFRAVAGGSSELELAYARTWETIPPEQAFTLFVIVKYKKK